MNITRNNYETYFLLYVDGELNAADQQTVENFTSLHPDLKEELDMLMDTVLDMPADTSMPGKHLLLKPEQWEAEALTTQQQELFLLLDNELPVSKVSELEAAIEKDPLLQKEWNLLTHTQLIATAIEMPDKESLYRKERDRKPIPISWVKWMAAAAVLSGLGWYGISIWNTKALVSTPNVAVTKDPVIKTPLVKNDTDIPAKKPVITVPLHIDKPVVAVNDKTDYKAADKKIVNPKMQAFIANQKNVNQPDKQLPVYTLAVANQPLIETVKQNTIAANTTATPAIKEISNPLTINAVENNGEQKSIAQQAVYKEDPYAGEDEYVTIAGAHIKKQKLRGVFRNVTRTVTRSFDKSNIAQADVAALK